MKYVIQQQSSDGIGGWSEWRDVANFKFRHTAESYKSYVESYQHEESPIDRVNVRVVERDEEWEQ